jgi:transposase-like protein
VNPEPIKKWCKPCKVSGQLGPATRVVVTNNEVVDVCDKHFQQHRESVLPSPGGTEAKPVTANVDWNKVQQERSAGVRVVELAKKYGISDVTIYARTKAPDKKALAAGLPTSANLPAPAAKKAGALRKALRPGQPQDAPIGSLIAPELASLKQKRAALDLIIKQMEFFV